MKTFIIILICLVHVTWSHTVRAQDQSDDRLITAAPFSAGVGVLRSSLSPDKRYGVLVGSDGEHDTDNRIVEVKSGRVVAVIHATSGFLNMNHGGMSARWSADGGFLLWEVDGKWSPRALVLIKLAKGKPAWQRNLLRPARNEILSRTRRASPKKYAAIKKRNSDLDQDTYPDGFTVNVEVGGDEGAPLEFPVNLKVTLESDPKAMESPPKNQLSSEMDAIVDSNGTLVVKMWELE